MKAVQFNLLFAWLWILFGFVSGMVLGMCFQGEDWLGGYGSFKRRMYRLGHISFFGLGVVNLLFWLTMNQVSASAVLLSIASWALVIGGITMPVGCVILAHCSKARVIFAVPVVSLMLGAVLTLAVLVRGAQPPAAVDAASNHQLSTLKSP